MEYNLNDDWVCTGKNRTSLSTMAVAVDNATKSYGPIFTEYLEILSYVGEKKIDGKECIFFHLINKEAVSKINTSVLIERKASYVEKKQILKFLPDWKKNMLLLRYNDPTSNSKKCFAVTENIFNSLGGNTGHRFAGSYPGFCRNLLLMEQFIKSPEEISFLLRYEDGYAKAFAATRGKYTYISQKEWVKQIEKLIDTQNNADHHWTVTNWSMTQYLTQVIIEDLKLNEKLKEEGVDITPALVFITSDTGNSSVVCRACARYDDNYFIIKEHKKRHTPSLNLDSLFASAEGLCEDSIAYCNRLKGLVNSPSHTCLFANVISGLKIESDEKISKMIGKKDFFSVTKKEIELSDKTDQTQYDVIRRVFALGAKLRNTEEYERRAAKSLEILEKIGGAK